MTVGSVLHDLPVEFHLLLWGLPLVGLGLGLALALAVSRPEGRLGRALHGAGPVLAVVAIVLLLPRLIQILHPEFGGGPQRWVPSTINAVLPDTLDLALHPYDTAVAEHIGLALLMSLTWPLVSFIQRFVSPRVSQPLPLAWPAAVVLAAVGLFLPYALHHAMAWPVYVLGLEWIAATPIAALLLALRLHASWPADRQTTRAPTADAREKEVPDVRRAWIAAGVLDAEASPQVRLPGPDEITAAEEPPSEAVQRAWAASGQVNGPPGALQELLGSDDVRTLLVGDLPPHAEIALLDAFYAHLVGVEGHRILALVADPEAAKRRIEATLDRVHTWMPGAITAGGPALAEALSRKQTPTIAFATLADLDATLVPLASRTGRDWAASLTWMVLQHPERGEPLAVTHTAFALKRWSLATGGMPATSVLATGADTTAMLAFLDTVLPGREVRRCPIRLPAPGPVTIWPAHTERTSAADPWSARAAHAAGALGVDVQLYDPDLDRLAHQHPTVHRVDEVDVHGSASVARLSGHQLSQAWRAAHFRLPDPDAPAHEALWHVRPTPLGHFLATPGRLAALHERRELPVPKPVIGTRNRFLRLAHLRAALEDGHADERSLRRAFGDDVVDYVLGEVEPTGRWVARVRNGAVERAPVLRGPRGVDAPEPGRQALTAQRIQIVEERSGTALGEVDELVVATRFHPKRVFEIDGRRYRVPLHALDAKRRQLRVVPADPRDAVTRPILRMQIEPVRTRVDMVTRRQGGLSVSTLTLTALITEEVGGAWVPGEDQQERFEIVRSRYDTDVRLILPTEAAAGPGLGHLAGMIASLLPAHLAVGPEDFEVTVVGRGLVADSGPGVAVVDRHVGGLGVADALDDGTVIEVLRWVRAVLYACPCDAGCARCTPESVLRAGPDKAAVLRMLPVQP